MTLIDSSESINNVPNVEHGNKVAKKILVYVHGDVVFSGSFSLVYTL